MLEKFLKNYKSRILLIIIMICFSMFFPFVITTYKIDSTRIKVYKPDMLEKDIVMQTGNNKETMDVELFIPLVLYSVMSDEYEEETLKTMIVILRTYILYTMQEEESINVENLALPYTTYSELEKKWGKNYEEKYMFTMKLLKETNGKVINYNGELIYPYYHELSAGITNVGEFEYLQSVESTWDTETEYFENTLHFTGEKICQILSEKYDITLENSDLTSKIQLNMEENGKYVRSVSVGEIVIGADDWKEIFELPSTAFVFENFSGEYRIITYGKGNGKGLSIYGANSMAKEGKDYNEILKYYYSGIEIRGIL